LLSTTLAKVLESWQ